MVRQRLPAATRTAEWLYIIAFSPLVGRSAAHCSGPAEGRSGERNARRRYLHLTDLATASGRTVAFIPAAATFGLAGGLRVLTAALAGCARAGCALTLLRFHRHWKLLFHSELDCVGLRQQLKCRIGAPSRDCMKRLFCMNESAI